MAITPYVPPTWLSSLPSGIWNANQGLSIFPYLPGQTPDVTKTPEWNTYLAESTAGTERRTSLRPYPRWIYNVKYEVVREKPAVAELAVLFEFFNVMKGQYAPFYFVDPSANTITTQTAFGTGDGATRTFQLQRAIRTYTEPVLGCYLPAIYVNGTLKTLTTDYTVGAGGLITFVTAPAAAAALTWTGYYYFKVRFDQDALTMRQIDNALWSNDGLQLKSLLS